MSPCSCFAPALGEGERGKNWHWTKIHRPRGGARTYSGTREETADGFHGIGNVLILRIWKLCGFLNMNSQKLSLSPLLQWSSAGMNMGSSVNVLKIWGFNWGEVFEREVSEINTPPVFSATSQLQPNWEQTLHFSYELTRSLCRFFKWQMTVIESKSWEFRWKR